MDNNINIALVAHDNKKKDLVEWFKWNREALKGKVIVCTGTTGKLLEKEFNPDEESFRIIKLKSGPLGGDQQLGAMIAEGKIDVLIFFWDPMQPQPHDVDVKALLRISVLYNVPTACNRSTADYIISSPLLKENYVPQKSQFEDYTEREI